MTITGVLYYEISCNELGCKAAPDNDYDYSAWKQAEVALDMAYEAGWGTDDEGHHWCPSHLPNCNGQHLRDEPEDPCRRCKQWPEDDKDGS